LHIKKLVDAAAMALGHDDPDRRTADQRRADGFVDLVTGQVVAPNIDLSVVVTADVLGCSDASGELTGYGPITFGHVKEIVGDGLGHVSGVSRVTVADEETGGLLEVEPRYRPHGGWMKQCDFATLCVASPAAEGTDNLAALCRHHHRLKHKAGWKLSSRPDGALAWTTPTGATVVTWPWKYIDWTGGSDPPPG
jgi:hypothetical protein